MLRTLTDAFLIPERGQKALIARVRLLSDLGVPKRGRPTAHVRLSYGLLEVSEIAMALALMNAHMPPVLAARHVREAWGGFVRMILSALIDEIPERLRARYREMSRGNLGVIQGNVLRTLGSREMRDVADETPLAGLRIVSDSSELVRLVAAPASIVVDAKSFAPRLFRSLCASGPDGEQVQIMLDRLRESARDTLTS